MLTQGMRGYYRGMGGGRDGHVTVGGLENDSAFCFMNSVLQSMASLDRLDDFLGGTQYEGVKLDTTSRKRYEESEEEDSSDEGVENGPEGPVSEAETEIEQVPEGPHEAAASTVPEAEDDLEKVNAEAEAGAELEEEPKQPTALELSSLIPGFPAQPEKADPEEVTEVTETSTTVQNPICPSSLESFHSSTGLGAFSYELKRMFAQLNTLSNRSHTYSGLPITRAMGKSGQRWDGYEQEDAGEFFQQLIDKLENEVKAKAGENKVEEKQDSGESTALDKWKKKMLIPFDGVQATTIKCLTCGDLGDGIRYNIMGALGLSLPNQTSRFSRSTHTLKECIDMFAEREIIDGVSCERCSLREYKRQVEDQISKVSDPASPIVQLFQARLDKVDLALSRDTINEEEYNDIFKKNTGGFAKVFVQKSKQTLIGVAPQILCVTINRSQFDMNTGMSFKNSANVRFPSLMCLDEWMDDKTQTKKMYRLKSVVSHYGSHDYGHYIAYRLSRDKWWRISDETVYQTELSYVLSDGSIFMLFYELAAPEESEELYTQMIEEQKEQQSHGSGAAESSEEESEEEDESEAEEQESEDEDME
ncbi:Ubiquitin carboxyl-terminal hydrolase 1 [Yarrowia sp. E02]|nr:Ubiquitin carboxyl-terminal hydrolase 1 [Yarrowia sp. E02]